jgi:hypothetical protein
MSKQDSNSIPELVELLVRIEGGNEGSRRNVNVDLRVHPASLDGPHNMTFSTSLKRLTLDLELNGTEAVPGSRFGEPTRPNEAIHERTVSTERSIENQSSGEAGLNSSLTKPLEFSGKGSGSLAVKTKQSSSHSEREQHLNVRAMGNLKWEVTQPRWEKQVLDLTYLNNETICKIEIQDRANHKSVQLKASAKQKDIVFEVTKTNFPSFLTTNQKRLMNILLSKALSSEGTFDGTVIFSKSVFEIED